AESSFAVPVMVVERQHIERHAGRRKRLAKADPAREFGTAVWCAPPEGRTMVPFLKSKRESRLRRLHATQNISLYFRSGRTRRFCLERRNGPDKAGRHSQTGIRENRRAADDYRPGWGPGPYVQLPGRKGDSA